jgi:DNA-directed RNA polymerase specialized sigma24 family protein
LHTSDYYLTAACAEQYEAAWRKFYDEFRRFIHRVARFVSTSPDIAEEVAGWLLSNLCQPDRSGRMRIDRFDGRSSLATWLRVMICHRAINERERRHNAAIPVEDLADLEDKDGASRLESGIKN